MPRAPRILLAARRNKPSEGTGRAGKTCSEGTCGRMICRRPAGGTAYRSAPGRTAKPQAKKGRATREGGLSEAGGFAPLPPPTKSKPPAV